MFYMRHKDCGKAAKVVNFLAKWLNLFLSTVLLTFIYSGLRIEAFASFNVSDVSTSMFLTSALGFYWLALRRGCADLSKFALITSASGACLTYNWQSLIQFWKNKKKFFTLVKIANRGLQRVARMDFFKKHFYSNIQIMSNCIESQLNSISCLMIESHLKWFHETDGNSKYKILWYE